MLHLDIPTRSDIERLFTARHPASLSLYLPTTPLTQAVQASRIELKNLVRNGIEQLHAIGIDRAQCLEIEEALADLGDDEEFWRLQANSLALFVTPERLLSFRLPNALSAHVEAADRFYLKPLLRAVTVPQSAFVLALSQGAARLVEVFADLPAVEVSLPELPTDAASALGKASLGGRSPSGRIQGSEGQKVRLRQYARQVDAALRDLLGGRETPLILAATQPLDAIYRAVNSYPHLVDASLPGSPDRTSDDELAAAARRVLDELHRSELEALHRQFAQRSDQGRTTTDIVQAARAATAGAIAVLLVDIDEVVPGTVDEQGNVSFAETESAASYGVVDEIAGRAYLTGARVLGERRADIPGGGNLAAILRYAI